MKLTRRLLSLLLALLMILSLAACGGGGDSTDVGGGEGGGKQPSKDQSNVSVNSDSDSDSNVGTDSDVTDDFVMPDRPIDEMSGKEYVIIQHEPEIEPFGFVQDSKMNLAVLDRIKDVEELYGCTIAFRQIPASYEFVSQIQALSFAEKGGDMVSSYEHFYLRYTIGFGGDECLMQDLLAVDDIINFWDNEKWGGVSARESLMAGGSFYGVCPALWAECTPLPYYQIVYNKALLKKYNVTDPQEYWEKEEWDRYAMLDVITGTTDEADGVWGITAKIEHMLRASFLATGQQLVSVDKVNADGTAEWTNGLKSPEALEAIQWLKNTLGAHAKCFNNGKYEHGLGWGSYGPFNQGLCAMAMTRPVDLFDYIVTESEDPFGLTVWAGAEPNVLSGYYETIHTIAIPVFSQNIRHSAFLMADLFEGLDGVDSYDAVLEFYADEYFDTELDLMMLTRTGAKIQYSYWPIDSGLDAVWRDLRDSLMTGAVSSLIPRFADTINSTVEAHILPNKVVLDKLSKEKDFD